MKGANKYSNESSTKRGFLHTALSGWEFFDGFSVSNGLVTKGRLLKPKSPYNPPVNDYYIAGANGYFICILYGLIWFDMV